MTAHTVIDSSVLIHDPLAVSRFDESIVVIDEQTIAELHELASGNDESARNARDAASCIESMIADTGDGRHVRIEKYLGTNSTLPPAIETAIQLSAENLRVTFMSRDATARIIARSHGIESKDYAMLRNSNDESRTQIFHLPRLDPERLVDVSKDYDGIRHLVLNKADHNDINHVAPGHIIISGDATMDCFVAITVLVDDSRVIVKPLVDESGIGDSWGVRARNLEQAAALAVLLDPYFDLVTIVGDAGTGKTLVALAAGLRQVFDAQRYNEILVTRATVSIGEDIGFLPGTEEEKMNPWMGALEDNLQILLPSASEGGGQANWGKSSSYDFIKTRLGVRSMNYMRGRTFLDKFVIIDESQNLTPHQVKMLVTRAGTGSKIVFIGNMAQIDTPWLSETTSGLGWLRNRFASWQHSAHVTLSQVERSRLALHAVKVL